MKADESQFENISIDVTSQTAFDKNLLFEKKIHRFFLRIFKMCFERHSKVGIT